jgi:hypothetical protein
MASRRRGRGGDAGNWNRNQQQAPAHGTKRFPKEPAMRTFSALSAQEKRDRQRAEQNSWLGQPPADVNLTEVCAERLNKDPPPGTVEPNVTELPGNSRGTGK